MNEDWSATLPSPQPPPKKRKAVRLNDWDEVEQYFKEHLTPCKYGPKGQPIYAQADIDALNVILPEEY